MKKKEKLKIKAIKCPKCKEVIFSRARHDFHYCSCNSLYVDGGFDYLRYGGKEDAFDNVEFIDLELDVTKKELYDDWNKKINKFGVIANETDTSGK